MSRSSQIVSLSLRERTEIDAVFSRVRRGGHYEVLGLSIDVDEETVLQESSRLRHWAERLLEPERLLGEYQPKVEAIVAAVDQATRVLGNPRERLRYDSTRPRPSDPSQRTVDAAARAAGASPTPRTPPPRPGPESQVRFLLAALDAQLSMVFGRPVGLVSRLAEFDLTADDKHARTEAENAEREERWVDAVVWWHLAGVVSPRDPTMLLRAGSAMRRAGAVGAFAPYARVVTGDPWFGRGER